MMSLLALTGYLLWRQRRVHERRERERWAWAETCAIIGYDPRPY